MAMFDFLGFGGSSAKKKPAGPHVTRDRQNSERKERLASMQGQYDKQNAAAAAAEHAAADKAKLAADTAAKRKKKAGDFWNSVLK